MRKRTLLFLFINLFAAVGLAVGAYMPWLGEETPQTVSLASILPFDLPDQMTSFYLSAIAPLLAGAVLIGVGGLFSLRSMVIAGLTLNVLVSGLWIWHFGFTVDSLGMNDGFSLTVVSIIVALLSLLLHRHQRSHEKKKYGRH